MAHFSIMQIDDTKMVLILDNLPVAVIVHEPPRGSDVQRDWPTPRVRFHGVQVVTGNVLEPRLVESNVSGSSDHVVTTPADTRDLVRTVARSLCPSDDSCRLAEHWPDDAASGPHRG